MNVRGVGWGLHEVAIDFGINIVFKMYIANKHHRTRITVICKRILAQFHVFMGNCLSNLYSVMFVYYCFEDIYGAKTRNLLRHWKAYWYLLRFYLGSQASLTIKYVICLIYIELWWVGFCLLLYLHDLHWFFVCSIACFVIPSHHCSICLWS